MASGNIDAPGGGSHARDSGDGAGGGQTHSGGAPFIGSGGGDEHVLAQVRGGRRGFMFGDDRAITNPPNWAVQDTHQLYNGAVNNNDPGTVDATGQSWMDHGVSLQDAANTLYEAISQLGEAWVGKAAGAAKGALAGIAKSSESAGEAAHTMGVRMTEQASAAAEVKKMPPPQEFDADQAMKAMLTGGPEAMTADLKEQSEAARDVKEQQVAYYNAYTAALQDTDSRTPSFGPDSLELTPATGSAGAGSSGIGGYGTGISMAGSPAAEAGVNAGAQQSGQHAPGHSPGGAAGHSPGGAAGHSGGTQPDPVAGHGGTAGASGQAQASSSSGPGFAASAGAGALGAGLGLGGAKALAKGKQTGSKRQHDGSGDGSAEGQADGSAGSPADGPADGPAGQQAPTTGTDPAGPQGAAAAGNASGGSGAGGPSHGYAGAGAAGGAVPPGAAPVGGGAAAGGAGGATSREEEQSRESYLIEPDPDALFGPGEALAPPVIGPADEDE